VMSHEGFTSRDSSKMSVSGFTLGSALVAVSEDMVASAVF
jgi:hypothetical protein